MQTKSTKICDQGVLSFLIDDLDKLEPTELAIVRTFYDKYKNKHKFVSAVSDRTVGLPGSKELEIPAIDDEFVHTYLEAGAFADEKDRNKLSDQLRKVPCDCPINLMLFADVYKASKLIPKNKEVLVTYAMDLMRKRLDGIGQEYVFDEMCSLGYRSNVFKGIHSSFVSEIAIDCLRNSAFLDSGSGGASWVNSPVINDYLGSEFVYRNWNSLSNNAAQLLTVKSVNMMVDALWRVNDETKIRIFFRAIPESKTAVRRQLALKYIDRCEYSLALKKNYVQKALKFVRRFV